MPPTPDIVEAQAGEVKDKQPIILKKIKLKTILVGLAVSLAGIGSGYLLSTRTAVSSETASPSAVSSGKEIGIQDDKTFRDCAEGILEASDLDDKKIEGSHKITREGGPSQTLYVTSSVLALDEYLGKKVEVCGETIQSKKVSWFMDVGKLKLLE